MGEATAVGGAPASQGWGAKQDLEEAREPDRREDEQGRKTGLVTTSSLLPSTPCLPDRPPHTHLSPPFLLYYLLPSSSTHLLSMTQYLHFVDGSALSSRPPQAPTNVRVSPVATPGRARQKSKLGDDAWAASLWLMPISSHSLTSPRLSQDRARPRWVRSLAGIKQAEGGQ